MTMKVPVQTVLLGVAGVVLAFAARAVDIPLGYIQTIIGGGAGDNGPATAALVAPLSVAFDAQGNTYVGETARVRKISTSGVITTIAGNGVPGYSGDGGPAVQAQVASVRGIAVDVAGNVYLSDFDNRRVRRIDTSGVMTTIAGDGTFGFSGDGAAATGATLSNPQGIAVDASGSVFFCDRGNNRVRKVAGGIITTVAGSGGSFTGTPPGDGGPATSAPLSQAISLVLDGAGGFFVAAGTSNTAIRHVDASGIITTRATAAGFAYALARDGVGNVLYANGSNIVQVDATGNQMIVAGGPGPAYQGFAGDGGPATSASLNNPLGVATNGTAGFFIADTSNGRIRKVDAAGIIDTVAGTRPFLVDGPLGTDVWLQPAGVAISPVDGAVIVGDSLNAVVRRMDAAAAMGTLAGRALLPVYGVAVDRTGNVYIADRFGNRVRKIDTSGTVTTIAANIGQFPDYPIGVAVDGAGNVLIATFNGRVLKSDSLGALTLVAQAPCCNAEFTAIAVDATGTTYVAEASGNSVGVNRIEADGTLTRIAGNGDANSPWADGVAATSVYVAPNGIAFDGDGNLYISHVRGATENFVRMVDRAGLIHAIAGAGPQGFSGDGGPATSAQLNSPASLAFDAASGHLLVADTGNGRVRAVSLTVSTPSAFAFPSQTGVPLASMVQSAAITPTGFNVPATIAVANGGYSVGCTGTFTTAAGTLNPGQSICLRHTSSSIGNATIFTTLTLGTRQGTFGSTTVPGPGSASLAPTSLDFGAQSMMTTAPAQAVTVTNTSSSDTVYVNGAATTPSFAATHNCGSLAPGASCTVTVTFTPAVQGVIDGSLLLQLSPGTRTVTLAGFGERSLATHYYRSILRRAPDVAGKAFWDGEASRLTSLGADLNEAWYAMSMSFFSSPEYAAFNRDDAGFVSDLYRTYFNRDPDVDGLSFWTGQIASGIPRENVLNSFLFSNEYALFTRAIFGNTAARAEVNQVMDFYRGMLARLPDNDGFTFWVQRFRAAQCGGSVNSEIEAISSQFTTGAEYLGRNRTNAQYVGDLYNAFFRRGGDAAGVASWIAKLDSGQLTREQLRRTFMSTIEFGQRQSAIIAQGCLR